ncbi:tryptophan-rich sensory protein [Caproicibacter sp. BJN0012]|uniref:tryptophan-rich sensory protein n=1 Tax=Caproicibacter sp. BJN0012 TaxID=3110227 RepID=UPI002E12B469|nr:tryptophan-rich sensory protein [Caproicibacter sp. BJN0012]
MILSLKKFGSFAPMIVFFRKINRSPALLQLPYLLRVLFAGYLHLMTAIPNRTFLRLAARNDQPCFVF